MARGINRLSAIEVEKKKAAGLHSDGGGLYLQVTKTGGKSWLFRYMRQGRTRAMGLGPLLTVSLATARLKAHDYRQLLAAGLDPFALRDVETDVPQMDEAESLTFRQCATKYHNTHKDAWKNPKHTAQWISTMETYAFPMIGDVAVGKVNARLVLDVLQPIWRTKNETASRLRGRIESVIDWATAHGDRSGENPARWKGHLDKLLMSRSKASKVVHHPALPYNELPEFLRATLKEEGIAPLALQLTILCASRTSEVINATFAEVDLDAHVWVIPAARMKSGREHRVPLSARACHIVKRMAETAESEFIFPGRKVDRPLSNMAMLQLLKRMGRTDLTVHGFRSTFRDWAGECTHHPRECIEFALAHTVKDKTEAAYFRGDLFEKRRLLMDDWAKFCSAPSQSNQDYSAATCEKTQQG